MTDTTVDGIAAALVRVDRFLASRKGERDHFAGSALTPLTLADLTVVTAALRDAMSLPAAEQTRCDQCCGAGWVRIAGKVDGALTGFETATECQACNPDGRIPYTGQPEFYVDGPHHLAHQTPPGVFDPNCPACKEATR